MAYSYGRLQFPSLSRALLPVFSRQMSLSSSLPRFNQHISTAWFSSFPADRTRLLSKPLHAQAKRGSLLRKEEVASAADLHFEVPLKIVKYPDPILRAKNKRIGSFDENLKKLVDDMFDVMYKTDGIGLSAPQVGINVQLMVFNPAGEPGKGEEIVLVNPKVSKFSNKKVLFNEGCLSFPGIYADVERPESVKIDARDITGAKFRVSLSGLPARVFQHEFDHLEGILFFDRMTDEVLDGIRAELESHRERKAYTVTTCGNSFSLEWKLYLYIESLEKQYEDKTGSPSPERIETRKRRKPAVGFGKS